MTVELVTLPPLRLVLSNKNNCHYIHFIRANIIWCSVFRILRVTISRFHVISVAFCPVINAVIVSVITGIYHSTHTLGIFFGIRDPCGPLVTRTVALCLSVYKLPNKAKRMRLSTRNPLHRLLRSDAWSHPEVHQPTYLIFPKTKVAVISDIHSDRQRINPLQVRIRITIHSKSNCVFIFA